MKKLILVLAALAIVASAGCGNRPEEKTETKPLADEASQASFIDPVDGQIVENIEEAKYSYVYNDTKYFFNSKKNYEAFKEDPAKYVK